MVVFSDDASQMLAERKILRRWVERTLEAPDLIERDPIHADRLRAYGRVPERGGRVLRGGYVANGDEVRIVAAFLDRSRGMSP